MSTNTFLITGATGLIGFRTLTTVLAAGHSAIITVRSQSKADTILSNPTITALAPGARLSTAIVPDYAVPGAFDAALRTVTHVIHVGSPVPHPAYDPLTQVFEPTLASARELLESAAKAPHVKRVVITSSIVGNMPYPPDPSWTGPATASDRGVWADPQRRTFEGVFDAYVPAKITELRETDAWVAEHKPKFTVSHVIPGYVFGRNELCLTPEAVVGANSSNMFLLAALTGADVPVPILSGYAHVDDVAEVHLKVALLEQGEGVPRDFGVSSTTSYDLIWPTAEKEFPKAVDKGVLKKGSMITMPVPYDSSETERVLGIKFKSFEQAVVDTAGQFLELTGEAKA